jgi:hypothetical protein
MADGPLWLTGSGKGYEARVLVLKGYQEKECCSFLYSTPWVGFCDSAIQMHGAEMYQIAFSTFAYMYDLCVNLCSSFCPLR